MVERTIVAEPSSVGDVADERAVDLELVHVEAAQVGQRRVAGAEVVDGQGDAELAQQAEHVGRPHRVGHDQRLGDLEDERARRHPVLAQGLVDLPGQAQVGEVAHRQVHGHRHVVALGPPLRDGAQRQVEHRERERRDEAGVLDDRQELVGHDDAALRVPPAHERLEADDRAGAHVDLRLVLQEQLAALEALAQLGRERQPGRGVDVVRGLVELEAAALDLRAVERDVGPLQQQVDVVAVRRVQRDARGSRRSRGARPRPGTARRGRRAAGWRGRRSAASA